MTRTILTAVLFALCGCTHIDGSTAPPQEIALRPYVAELRTVEVVIDGKAYDFLFDSGGGYTLLSPQILDAAGCVPSGQLTGFRMSGERVDFKKCGATALRIGAVTLHVESGVFDINALLPDTLPALHGVLSLHTFADGMLTIDLANERLIVETPRSLQARVRDMQMIDASFYNEIEGRGMDVYLKVAAGDRTVHMLLDSGNLGSNVLTPEAWREVSETAPPAKGEQREIVLGFGAAGERRLPVASRALIREGALNVEFVRSGIFTFDFPNRRAWVKWNAAENIQGKTGVSRSKQESATR